ncbi:MAG: signal peptidase I [Clostridia bacterium]|nr:signal peptidase I [Clostridia bacterium]
MNYNDRILENKEFNFFKQLMYNIALAVCIILFVAIVMVYGFKFQLYNVLTGSERPYIYEGDMVVVKSQDSYKEGDILKFVSDAGTPVTHRLIHVFEYNGETYYICHGDNVDNTNGSRDHIGDYQWEIDRMDEMTKDKTPAEAYSLLSAMPNTQMLKSKNIDGKVVGVFSKYGTYFTLIKENKFLLIAMVISIWGVSATIQNELDMKKDRRLLTK